MNPHELTREELSVLRNNSPFRGAARVLLRQNISEYRLDAFNEGDRLFTAGDRIEGLYVLVSGRVSLEGPPADVPGTPPIRHGMIEPGQVLGDFELLRPIGEEDQAPAILRDGAESRYMVSALAAVDSRAIFLPFAEIKRFVSDAKENPVSSLLLQLLSDSCQKAHRTVNRLSDRVKTPAYLLAESIEKLLVSQSSGAMKNRPFHPVSLVVNVQSKEVFAAAQQLAGTEVSADQVKAAARSLMEKGVIDQSVSHGPGSWRINRWALSDFLRGEAEPQSDWQ